MSAITPAANAEPARRAPQPAGAPAAGRDRSIRGVARWLAVPAAFAAIGLTASLALRDELASVLRRIDPHRVAARVEPASVTPSGADAPGERVDEQLAQMALRLDKAEEGEPAAAPVADVGADPAPAVEPPPAVPSPPATRLSRFGIVRLDGRAAWLTAPEGWIHAAVGEKLPGGATVLDVGRLNKRTAVFTDKGVIVQ